MFIEYLFYWLLKNKWNNLSFPRRRESRLINLFQTPAFETVSQCHGIGAITCDDANSQVTTSAFISALK